MGSQEGPNSRRQDGSVIPEGGRQEESKTGEARLVRLKGTRIGEGRTRYSD